MNRAAEGARWQGRPGRQWFCPRPSSCRVSPAAWTAAVPPD